jgi:hypothetical protein
VAGAATRTSTIPAQIEQGRVLDVDPSTWTVTVGTSFSDRPQSGVTFGGGYVHPARGEGDHCMPEIGALCWICWPSDGNRPFVLAWAAAANEGDFTSNRPPLNPGDHYRGTRDGNFVWVRRGGVIQIFSSALCQMLFLPATNTLQMLLQNLQINTLGGDLTWAIGIPQNTTDGTRPALFTLAAKQFADDPNPIAVLQVGSHDGDPSTILSLAIAASGAAGAAQQFNLKADDSGNLTWALQGNMSITVQGTAQLQSQGNMTLQSAAAATLSGQSATVSAQTTLELDSTTGTTMKSGGVLNVTVLTMKVNGGTYPVLLATPAFLAWLAGHLHVAAGVPTTPATVPPPAVPSVSLMSS